jgi:hypothetical protein
VGGNAAMEGVFGNEIGCILGGGGGCGGEGVVPVESVIAVLILGKCIERRRAAMEVWRCRLVGWDDGDSATTPADVFADVGGVLSSFEFGGALWNIGEEADDGTNAAAVGFSCAGGMAGIVEVGLASE